MRQTDHRLRQSGYWAGVFCVLLTLGFAFFLWQNKHQYQTKNPPQEFIIQCRHSGNPSSAMIAGGSQTITVRVTNDGDGDLILEELNLKTQPTPVPTIASRLERQNFPAVIPARSALNFEVTVECIRSDYGKLQVDVVAIGSSVNGNEVVNGRGGFVVKIVREINPDPMVATFGEVGLSEPNPSMTIRLWEPTFAKNVGEVSIKVSDPAITTKLEIDDEIKGSHHYVYSLDISIDTSLRPSGWLNESVEVTWNENNFSFPITAFIVHE